MRIPARSTPRALVAVGALVCGSLVATPARAADPIGYLDSAGCDVISGWSQDPDEPDKAIDVHIYFGGPAGTPGVPASPTSAGVHRDDLCTAIGSCNHGYLVAPPLSLEDGQPRDIYAYGIDSSGAGNNPLLGASPRTLACPPAATGILRRVADVASYDAWRFSSFWDLLPLGAAEADALVAGPDLPAKPELVKPDDGTEAIWMIDHGVRRQVGAPAITSWRFDVTTIEERPASDLTALTEGPPLRVRPVLVIRGGLHVVDDPLPDVEGGTGGSSSVSVGAGGSSGGTGGTATAGGSSAAPDAESDDSGCQLAHGRSGGAFAWVLGLLAFVTLSRRRLA